MTTQLTIRVVGVEAVRDGVIIILVQDKQQVPIAPELESDETKVIKKMRAGMMAIGIDLSQVTMPCNPDTAKSFRTGIWVTNEDYESMGKPTVGDVLRFAVEKEKVDLPIEKKKSPQHRNSNSSHSVPLP